MVQCNITVLLKIKKQKKTGAACVHLLNHVLVRPAEKVLTQMLQVWEQEGESQK